MITAYIKSNKGMTSARRGSLHARAQFGVTAFASVPGKQVDVR